MLVGQREPLDSNFAIRVLLRGPHRRDAIVFTNDKRVVIERWSSGEWSGTF